MPGLVEQCTCPAQYTGSSCHRCAAGHYRDYGDYTCAECPCHGHEDTCQQDPIRGEVVCTCGPGWVGRSCDTRPLDVRIRGPLVQAVRPGETVRFDCGARPQVKIEVSRINFKAFYYIFSNLRFSDID